MYYAFYTPQGNIAKGFYFDDIKFKYAGINTLQVQVYNPDGTAAAHPPIKYNINVRKAFP